MCGIVGIFGLQGVNEPKNLVEKMASCMVHRGPDASGVFQSGNIVLGHRRLSIIDLDSRSNQPLTDSSGRYTIVFNGEVYNYKEVRSWLTDTDFKTDSDTEVVLQAFIRWGKDCLSRFNGMFAFAVWDNEHSSLFIARDRLGIKPLYYYITDQSVLFASEVRSLLASGLIPKRINSESLVDYLRYQTVHAPYTIVDGIFQLMPGQFMEINDSGQRVEAYYALETMASNESSRMDEATLHKEIRNRFDKSVERRLVADVESGAFLSGGIDSSAVVASMAQVKDRVKTFSVTFSEPEYSEEKYAQIIAKKYSTEHYNIQLSPKKFLENLPEALDAMDHPSGDGPNTYVVSGAVKKAGVTMALSGLGGDELFAGYDVFKRSVKLNNNKWFMSFAPILRSVVAKPLKAYKRSAAGDKMYDTLMLDYWDVDYTFPLSRRVMSNDLVQRITDLHKMPPNRVKQLLEERIAYGKAGFNLPLLSKVSVAEICSYMQNILLRDTDQMSMAHSLEVRVPFLDHELVEFVLGISDDKKFPHTPKQLLVNAMGDRLPLEIVNRPKMGFTLPWDHWMRNELRSFIEKHLESLGKRSQFNASMLDSLLERYLNNDKRITWSRIWYLVVLDHWLERNGFDEE